MAKSGHGPSARARDPKKKGPGHSKDDKNRTNKKDKLRLGTLGTRTAATVRSRHGLPLR